MFKLLYKIFSFFEKWRREKDKAKKIKENPEKQPKSISYGLRSIFNSLFSIPCGALVALGPMAIATGSVIISILGVGAAIAGVAGIVVAIVESIMSLRLQRYINKKPIAWIALVILILSIIGCAAVVFFMCANLN